MSPVMQEALNRLGADALSEEAIHQHLAPLFSRCLQSERIYLANHTLGRPLDQMASDVQEAAALWEIKLGDAWEDWLAEENSFRSRVASLIHSPRLDCVVPKISAAHGLRAVLNALPGKPRVLSTRGEFDSIDVILKQYAALGRIEVRWIEPDDAGLFHAQDVMKNLDHVDLVVISQVMCMTGQIVHNLDQLADACHAAGAKLLVDAYHAVGVIPVDVAAMRVDFMIGGCYKYLRGGPGACFLYLSPGVLNSGLRPLDTGWFASKNNFGNERPDPPVLRNGGNAFLESTPPVFTYYQARSGLRFVLSVGVERLRSYGLQQLQMLKRYLHDAGMEAVGGDEDHGAFLTVKVELAAEIVARLAAHDIIADTRGGVLRLCPDCLTRDEELRMAASALGKIVQSL